MTFHRTRSQGTLARTFVRVARFAVAAAVAGVLAACQDDSLSNTRAYRPISQETLDLMAQKGTSRYSPVLIRTFKKEAELEIWKQRADGRFVQLKTYPMCRWSGQLGPKTREGDRQVPEGFYTITPGQMNPNSNYYLSFNVGYPNAYDKVHGYGGGLIMVHGACSSAGCFSMTDEQIAEIYAIARDGFAGGQREIQMQSMPFRMNAENLAKFRLDPNLSFWKELKKGADQFDVTKQEVKVGVCNRRYVFGADGATKLDPAGACPPLKIDESLAQAVAAKERQDEVAVAEYISKGTKPIRLVYADGGQHPDFAARAGDVSRPEALAQGPTEIALDDRPVPTAVKVAGLKGKQAPAPTLVAARAPEATKTEIAKIEHAQPVAAAAFVAPETKSASTDEATPFYKKWLGLGGGSEQAKASDAPVVLQPVAAPLPPRRAALGNAKAATPAPKPQASLIDDAKASDRMAALRAMPPARGQSGALENFRAYAPIDR